LAGRYRIIERIGSGGIGEVYRAVDEQTQTTVAIKFLRTGAARDLEQTSRLIEGAWTADLIRHENTVVVHETGLSEYGPFIVMEDLRGENVGKLLERHGRLKPPHAFAIIEPVLMALGVAHAVGLLHGDVKPENVVVCYQSNHRVTVKLLDFGAARTHSAAQSIVSTTEYLSPEQANNGLVDHRSDLFSACVLLYELLTNTRPFHGPSPQSTLYRIVNLPCPSLLESGLPHHGALWSVLRQALEKDPAFRFQSSRELLEALRPVMATDVPSSHLLSELLPPLGLLRAESGSMPLGSAVSLRPSFGATPSPESGSRLATYVRNTQRPASRTNESSRHDLTVPSLSPSINAPTSGSPSMLPLDRDSLGPVLPARYRGRYKVRALVWQALDEYLRARRPPLLRERLLFDLGTEEANDLGLGTLQGIVYCDLDTVTLYVEVATVRMFSEDPSWCKNAGREAVDGLLAVAASRSSAPTSSLLSTVRRLCRVAAPLFDFGDWQATQGADPRRATLTLTGVDPLCLGLRLFCVGLVERSVSLVHSGAVVEVVRGESHFMPRLILDIII
jgi:serine/threonine-protein kinase